MKMLQKLSTLIALGTALLLFQGCYTQFGSPESDSPEKARYEKYGERYESGDAVEESSDYADSDSYYYDDSGEVVYYDETAEEPSDSKGVLVREYYIYDDAADIYYDPRLFSPRSSIHIRLSFGDPYWAYHPRYHYYPRHYWYTSYYYVDPFWWDPWDAYWGWGYISCPPYYRPWWAYHSYYNPWWYDHYYYGGSYTYHDPIPHRKRDWDTRRPATGDSRPAIDRNGGNDSRDTYTSTGRTAERPPVVYRDRASSNRSGASERSTTNREVVRKKDPRSQLDRNSRTPARRVYTDRDRSRSSDENVRSRSNTTPRSSDESVRSRSTTPRSSDRSYRGSTSKRSGGDNGYRSSRSTRQSTEGVRSNPRSRSSKHDRSYRSSSSRSSSRSSSAVRSSSSSRSSSGSVRSSSSRSSSSKSSSSGTSRSRKRD